MERKLIQAVINNKDKLPYINLDALNTYRGWTTNFNISVMDGDDIKLNLKDEQDLFLLFVLASSWSKTGLWENAAYFTIYLKMSQKDDVALWLDEAFIQAEIDKRKESALTMTEQCRGVQPRKKISFRQDYYTSVGVLAKEWEMIKKKLYEAEQQRDYSLFVDYLSKIEGLGAGKNKMRIKILLILRELRCQKVFEHIPGEYCCVPDQRVKEACKALGIKLPAIVSVKSMLKASEIIYGYFGDLYDIPLFAYEDVKNTLD